MKTSSIFWGTLFIVLGLLVLINNIAPVSLYWGNLWQFWPIILVLFGIAMLVKNKVGKMVLASAAGITLAIIIFSSVKLTTNFIEGDFDVIFDDDGEFTLTEYNEEYQSNISKAVFDLDGGVGSFNISDSTNKLIYIRTDGLDNNFRLTKNEIDSTSKLYFKMKRTKFHFGKNKFKNKVDIALNENPTWDLNFDIGAASVNLDLTKFKVESIDLNIGAASLKTKLGALAEKTRFDIDAGASKIEISVPEKAGCQLRMDDVLSSKNIDGFKFIKSGLYRTEGFNEAKNKIFINIDCGVSSIKVYRYKYNEEI